MIKFLPAELHQQDQQLWLCGSQTQAALLPDLNTIMHGAGLTSMTAALSCRRVASVCMAESRVCILCSLMAAVAFRASMHRSSITSWSVVVGPAQAPLCYVANIYFVYSWYVMKVCFNTPYTFMPYSTVCGMSSNCRGFLQHANALALVITSV